MISILDESKAAAPTATLDEPRNYKNHGRHFSDLPSTIQQLLRLFEKIKQPGYILSDGEEFELLEQIRQIRAAYVDEASNSTYRHISSFLPQQDDI